MNLTWFMCDQIFSCFLCIQGCHFMSTTMYDAREAMVPGSVYDRSGQVNGGLCIIDI